MKTKEVIKEAWEITMKNRQLKWLNFFAAFYLVLSWGVRSRYLLPDKYMNTRAILEWIPAHIVEFIIIGIVIYITYAVIPIIFNGSIISIIAGIKRGKPIDVSQGISIGMLRFLPLFEYRMFFTPLRLATSASIPLIAWKYLELYEFWQVLVLFGFFIVINIILHFFFAYSEYFIVLCDSKFTQSIKRSLRFILFYWDKTLAITILIFMISIMTILNVFMLIAIPIGLGTLLGFLTSMMSVKVAYLIWGVLMLLFLYFLLNVFAYFGVFTKAIWCLTFLELMEKDDHKSMRRKLKLSTREFDPIEQEEALDEWELKDEY